MQHYQYVSPKPRWPLFSHSIFNLIFTEWAGFSRQIENNLHSWLIKEIIASLSSINFSKGHPTEVEYLRMGRGTNAESTDYNLDNRKKKKKKKVQKLDTE